nr:histidine kinase [uncultured Bacteroides sp.]
MKYILKALIHTLFWLVYLLFSLVMEVVPSREILGTLQNLTPQFYVNFIWATIIFYVSYYWLIRYFEKRQLVKYLILSITLSVVVSAIFLLLSRLLLSSFNLFDYHIFLLPMIGSFIIAQCGCLVRGFENWFANIQVKSEIENKNLKNELKLLKLQINPHFLFNTLNNIDCLIYKSPKDASKMLITLSEMLRYMIYETGTDVVPLQKEIDYLTSYIQLQQLRVKDNDYVKFSFPQQDVSDRQIAPMLFISFVENAFKHSCHAELMPVINTNIHLDGNTLKFSCANYFDAESTSKSDIQSGVGLENVRRRLVLLYPGRHDLQITKKSNIFSVELTINL